MNLKGKEAQCCEESPSKIDLSVSKTFPAQTSASWHPESGEGGFYEL